MKIQITEMAVKTKSHNTTKLPLSKIIKKVKTLKTFALENVEKQ